MRRLALLVVGLWVGLGWSSAALGGMIHYYSFTTDATDAVGGAHGTLVGGASVVGGELLVDGIDDYVQLGEHIVPTSGSYTIALFARQSGPQSGHRELISQGISEVFSQGPGFYIGHDPAGQIRVTDSWQNTGVPFPSDEQFHHFVVAVDSGAGESRLYLDGVLKETLSFALVTTSGGNNTRFGNQYDAGSEHFAGALDEIRIYDHALSASEIAAIPEPSTALLLGLGLVGMAARRRVAPLLAGALVLGMLGSPVAQAVTFQEGFEGDLSAWTSGGVQGLPHSGVIVPDPFDPSNHVLTFSTTTWGGDIFTVESFGHSAGSSFRLSWDYLGLCGHSDCGGLVGVWDDVTGAQDHDWLAGSNTNYPTGTELITPDTGNWNRFSIDFVVPDERSVFLMLEDFVYSVSATSGDAYFDNVELQVVPEPSTALLLGLGLAGMAARRRV